MGVPLRYSLKVVGTKVRGTYVPISYTKISGLKQCCLAAYGSAIKSGQEPVWKIAQCGQTRSKDRQEKA